MLTFEIELPVVGLTIRFKYLYSQEACLLLEFLLDIYLGRNSLSGDASVLEITQEKKDRGNSSDARWGWG